MSERPTVDLSRAKVGDVVVFRHGGRMPIGRIQTFEVESDHGTNTGYSLWVGKEEDSEHIGNFSCNGINEHHPYQDAYCELISVERAT